MEVCFLSDVGQKRHTNQDYTQVYYNRQGYLLALLADGMGGHQAGDVASMQTVEDIGKKWQEAEVDTGEEVAKWLIQTIQDENQVIKELGESRAELNGMGTTIVAVVSIADQFIIAYVGDSRIYLLREGQLIQLTEDHSLVNELVKSGEISPEMAVNHPRKNVLTRSIGMPNTLEVDVANHFYQEDDYLLLCSDGLTNMVTEGEMAQIIEESPSMPAALQALIDRANEYGGLDNITALLLHYGGEVIA